MIGSAIHRDGRPVVTPDDPAALGEACRRAGGIAWVGLVDPTEEEFGSLAGQFGLHELAVEDAVLAHQRATLERYGDTLFCVLRPARYIDDTETVAFGELHELLRRGRWRCCTRSWTGWWTSRSGATCATSRTTRSRCRSRPPASASSSRAS